MADAGNGCLAYGSYGGSLSVAVMMLWIAAAAEVNGPLLINYFIINMVAPPPFCRWAGRPGLTALRQWGFSFWRRVCITPSLYYLTGRALAWFSRRTLRTMDTACASRFAFDTQPVGQ